MELCNDRVDEFLNKCFRAGIKNPLAFILSKMPQVYDWLTGAFPRGILPTDIDGEVEINGYFLRFEFKHEAALRNGRGKKGQLGLFRKLTETGKFTVFLVGVNDTGDPCCIEVYSAKEHRKLRDATREQIRELCRRWAEKAERGNLEPNTLPETNL